MLGLYFENQSIGVQYIDTDSYIELVCILNAYWWMSGINFGIKLTPLGKYSVFASISYLLHIYQFINLKSKFKSEVCHSIKYFNFIEFLRFFPRTNIKLCSKMLKKRLRMMLHSQLLRSKCFGASAYVNFNRYASATKMPIYESFQCWVGKFWSSNIKPYIATNEWKHFIIIDQINHLEL